jgi:GNAT superfamily N-acetyltransferase
MLDPQRNTALTYAWLLKGDDATRAAVIALRRRIYGSELGWIQEGSGALWDAYDAYSSLLVVSAASGEVVATSRLTVASKGSLEVSDLVDWKCQLPSPSQHAVAAEWSRVMIRRDHRGSGIFKSMYRAIAAQARREGAQVLCGASVAGLRSTYESLGFSYLDIPFRCDAFDDSPSYLPAFQVL